MLSRATRLADLLLIRAPDVSFFLKGPPQEMKDRLDMFSRRTNGCRKKALQLVQELGLGCFLHGDC